jgi:hypothetical protein
MSNQDAVSLEVAKAEIDNWLEYKRISGTKAESQKDAIEMMVSAVQEGNLTLNEDFSLTYALKFPIGESEDITEFKFKPRVSRGDLQRFTAKVKPSDIDGRIDAYICALTNQLRAIVTKLDSEDSGICQAIAGFFF